MPTLDIKSRRCAELNADLRQFNHDLHRAELNASDKRNQITRKRGEISQQENEVARWEALALAPGSGGLLRLPGRIAVGIVGAANRAQLEAAKRRLAQLRDRDLPRLRDELREINHRIGTIERNIAIVREERQSLGCA
ncbi:hypothetical protein [Oceaniradius stylonematis]|uniref:hypothetical protein n=1 Tax=Oceaniradius stylonematis TaxID=2184161 RepID=UPI0035CF4D4A